MENTLSKNISQSYKLAGLFTLGMRLVVGWTYFSAFWRRLILENKLDPDAAGYIGEKFNHFLPNALGIKPFIEFLVTNPDTLWWAMTAFTIVEGVVGLFFMLGLLTRFMSIGVFSLAMGILLGAGWLGTTCLDEWQIGVLGIAAGFTVFLSGGGKFSLDNWLTQRRVRGTDSMWFAWLGSGALALSPRSLERTAIAGFVFIAGLTLFTNQYFHGGVWGTLHNKSVKPKIEISNAVIERDGLSFEVYRVEGADVYGSFLIGVTLRGPEGKTWLHLTGEDLALFPRGNIDNKYVAKVRPGDHSLIVPLGARAVVTIDEEVIGALPRGDYELILTDISGLTWERRVTN